MSKGRLSDKYTLLDTVLGRGSFAVVKHCQNKKTGALLACKMISKYSDGPDQPVQTAESLNDEIVIFKRAGSHPNVLEIYDVYETSSLVYLILELATGGTLTDRIALRGISEADAASAFGQATAAVAHLHAHSIVHRDIKMDNILLAAPDTFVVKLADFGLSKLVGPRTASGAAVSHSERRMMMASAQGSPAFMPPELFELCMLHNGDNPSGRMVYDQSCDVWALGIVLCMLVTGVHPLRGLSTWQDFLAAMQSGALTRFDAPCWDAVTPACKGLLRDVLQRDPLKRASPAQILAHDWVAGGAAPATPLPHVLDGLKELRLHALQKIVLQVMETRLEKDQLADTDRLFAELDLDRTGVIRRHEMAEVLHRQGFAAGSQMRAALDICFDALDLRGDGVVSLPEFRAAVLAQHSQLLHSLLRPVFDHLDVHGTGDICAAELVTAFRGLGGSAAALSERDAQALLADFDLNGAGTLNFDEFCVMMSKESMGSSASLLRAPAAAASSQQG